jgi:hypothetical protein
VEFAQQWGTPEEMARAAAAADVILARLEREPLHRQVADRILNGRRRPELEPPKPGGGPTSDPSA